MTSEPRSLWELYDSPVEPWRRGRSVLILIGLAHFVLQSLVLLSALLVGDTDHFFIFAVAIVFFWLQFYFVWIGVHWVRWIWGAWDIATGFCLLIWAWRDENGWEALFGSLAFLAGFYLCLSPSVYFFAKRQKERVRWRESLLIAGISCLVLLSIAAMALGMFAFRQETEKEAAAFAQQADDRIYIDRDLNWLAAHVTRESLQRNGLERLRYFFEVNEGLGSVRQLSPVHVVVKIRLQLPFDLRCDARVDGKAETDNGPVALHAIMLDNGKTWEFDRIWWTYLPMNQRDSHHG